MDENTSKQSGGEEKQPAGNRDEISGAEWGMVIGALVVVDALQFGLDFLYGLGEILNPFIDIATGLSFSSYLYFRGVKMNARAILSLSGVFLGEMIPVANNLPFWSAEGALIMAWEKGAKKIIQKAPGGDIAVRALEMRATRPPRIPNSGAKPPIIPVSGARREGASNTLNLKNLPNKEEETSFAE